MEKEMEKEQNIIKMVKYFLKEIINLEKNGMIQDMITNIIKCLY